MMISAALNCLWPLTRNSLNLRLILKDRKLKIMLHRPSKTCINRSLWHKHGFIQQNNKWATLISLRSPTSVVFTSRNLGRRNTYPCPSLTFSTSPWNKTRLPNFYSISKHRHSSSKTAFFIRKTQKNPDYAVAQISYRKEGKIPIIIYKPVNGLWSSNIRNSLSSNHRKWINKLPLPGEAWAFCQHLENSLEKQGRAKNCQGSG